MAYSWRSLQEQHRSLALCVAIPAAGEAASPAQHREAVLLRKGGFEARRVWCVVMAEHCCFAGSSLGICTLLACLLHD